LAQLALRRGDLKGHANEELTEIGVDIKKRKNLSVLALILMQPQELTFAS
jgi:hypothetical protein